MKNAQGNLYAQKTDGAMKNTIMLELLCILTEQNFSAC